MNHVIEAARNLPGFKSVKYGKYEGKTGKGFSVFFFDEKIDDCAVVIRFDRKEVINQKETESLLRKHLDKIRGRNELLAHSA